MKRFLLLIAIMAVASMAKSQQYNVIDSQRPQNSSIEILSESNSGITLKLNVNAYSFNEVQTPNGSEVVVTSPDGINYMEKGIPDVPYFATSICIPAKGKAIAEIIGTEFITLNNISVAPSKGSISRNIDPATVPYEYGKCYSTDAFIPSIEANNSEAFCIRDVRGTSVRFFPFQYNPVQKQLKIYTEIIVKVKFSSESDVNEISRSLAKINEFESIYSRLFINYNKKNTRYTQLQDGHPGRMLIICKDTYASAMSDFVTWKREKGIETELVLMSTVGSTAANVQSYITNYFNSHDDLAYILLVGDGADVPSNISTTGSGYMSETKTSDNQYAYLVGDDHYADVFIGRFSGESVANIQNQVRKVILYEKELATDASWLTKGYGSASTEGGGTSGHNQGHGAESDMTHMGYIQTDLENYGYTVSRVNQSGSSWSGGSSDIAATSAAFNAGVGLACYIGHGDTQEWASTGYTNTQVNALTNENKLPFIISVACVNGDFNGNTCFAEAWLRASKNGNPTGALAFLGSTINQDWNPPMTAQDEMVDIIVESLEGNIKRTIGGISFNGYFRMIQDHPSGNSTNGDGPNTADTWTIFGDPSTMFRSKTPQEMTITHPNVQTIRQTTFAVNCDADGALVALSKTTDGQTVTLGYGYVSNGIAEVTHTAITEPGNIKLTVTAYNKVTYQSDIMVIVPEGPYVINENFSINDSEGNNNGNADYNETIKLNQTLRNVGVETAENVNVTIATTSNDITISDNSEAFGNITSDNNATRNNAFELSIHNGIADQTIIPLSYSISCENSDTHTGNFVITANAPKPEIVFVSLDDSENGNNNGLLDPGENAILTFKVTNNGHAQMEAGNAILTSTAEGITIVSAEATTNAIDASNNQNITFEISVSDDLESGSNVCFAVNFTSGLYPANTSTCLSVGLQIEDWESNSFDSYAWENNSATPWRIVSGEEVYDGEYCAKSGAIGNSKNTDLTITVNVLYNDNIEFYKKVSCEAPGSNWYGGGQNYYDYLAFYIDGTMKGQWAGTTDNWSLQSYPVTAGNHTLKWSYVKDYSTTSGSDCAWIDNIKLPAHSNAVTSIHADMNFAENSMSIYPNPANENAYINLNLTDDNNVTINIYNSVGQIVKTIDSINLQSGENYVMIETSSLNAGMYVVKANVGNNVITKNLSVIR